MLTLILAGAAGCGVFAAAYFAAAWSLGWSIFLGVLGFGVCQGVAGVIIQKRVKADMERVQAILANGQRRLQEKMQRWQMRPPGSIQAAQKEIFADTKVFVREALAETEVLRTYRWWVPLVERQMATAQLQLNWMIKEFKAVDALMPKALFIDPTMAAIKMARLYMLDAKTDEIGRVYTKAVRRLRYNQNVLLAATWSWILIQRKDVDGAFRALTEALKKSDNETLKRNHELLMNNRVAHVNNSGLGDQWYSLQLEEPRVRMQRQHAPRM
jgi:predicted ATPase